jgi:hypothetical protein
VCCERGAAKNWCLKRNCVSRLGSTAPFLAEPGSTSEHANGSLLAFGGKKKSKIPRNAYEFIRFVSAKRKE